jgi:mannose-6-phosphate isomerase class I
MKTGRYDKFPVVEISDVGGQALRGWPEICRELLSAIDASSTPVLAIECYPGVFQEEIGAALRAACAEIELVDMQAALLPEKDITQLAARFTGGDDPVFGFMSDLTLRNFFDSQRLDEIRKRVSSASSPLVLLGPGAFLAAPGGALHVYADLPRWEIQQRQRRGQIANLGSSDTSAKASLQYKRAYFVDWRVADGMKRSTMERWDYLLDTTAPCDPRLVEGAAFRAGLSHCATRPFRTVPFFDPGPWGGQWMKQVCGLDHAQSNFAWCFDCVPEENSLRLRFGNTEIQLPAIDLVFAEPKALLGEAVHDRFGAEFPIRFDMLDTMGGGNLSLQVHPLTSYIREQFGLTYTQDESYYVLDARPGARVYLGCKAGTRPAAMEAALSAAQRGEGRFRDEDFVARFPAKAHDHFLIPAGTLHCSGADTMVLEISATPYIFTFKLWDWERLGLDGRPRPINIERGMANICWDRDEHYVARHLVNRITPIGEGPGWREERTGLHETEFIETRRHWFTDRVPHDTGGKQNGGVHVLNLVAGDEAIVESPEDAFDPFIVHYAETFIVPAAVGPYTIRPHGSGEGQQCATIKAYVRTGT